MKIEELLRPRYKVIADYPHNGSGIAEGRDLQHKSNIDAES